MASLLSHRGNGVSILASPPKPVAGTVISVILAFGAISTLSYFLTHKSIVVKSWRSLPFVALLVFAIYIDSWAFVFASGIINYGIGVDSNLGVCSSAILLCLFCYVSTKILIYIFLVEKAFIIGGGTKSRIDSRLYLFNSVGILTLYAVVCILNFVYRFARIDKGRCIIGIDRPALIPLIAFDVVVNVYLTVLFLNPLRNIYSFKGLSRTPANLRLRTVAMRTFVGALCTTASSIVNLTVLVVLNGEPGWVCLTCCNADILFSALVIQWITSPDNANIPDSRSPSSSSSDKDQSYQAPTPPPPPPPAPAPPRPPRRRGQKNKLAISLPLKTTSTSQYEHIFGDLEPDTEVDITSSSSASAFASSKTTKFGCGSPTYDYGAFENDDEYQAPDNISASPQGEEGESRIDSAAEIQDKKGKQVQARSPSTSMHLNRQIQPQPQSQSQPQSSTSTPPHTPKPVRESASVSPAAAAVAADLERLRRYRGRRQHWTHTPATATATYPTTPATAATRTIPTAYSTPPNTSTTRKSSARAPAHAYRISPLVFEGEEDAGSRWLDMVGIEEGVERGGSSGGSGGEEIDLGGWI